MIKQNTKISIFIDYNQQKRQNAKSIDYNQMF